MTTGMQLRLERVAARVTIRALAAELDRHPATVHRWELQAQVSEPKACEFRAGLANLADSATPEKVAA